MISSTFFSAFRLYRACTPILLLGLGSLLDAHAGDLRPLLRDFIGLNGHTVQFRPGLYQPVGRLARDYHPVEWDLGTNTAALPEFPFAKNRVDWNKVYGSWRAAGWEIDASLMFETIPQTNWTNLETDARAYGRAFAREFGPSGQRKLLTSVEIGNEPGTWSDADYTRMFRAMAEGIREGDPKLRIATGNVTTGKSGRYEKSVACVAEFPGLFDVLNVHTYAELEAWPTWRRSFPEDAKLARYLHDVEALCRWRDTHAPGKAVWITEFGYDSTTKPSPKTGDFSRWIGVTDTQQAQWLVRSLLVFSTLPVDRAYLYFFNDEDEPSLHASAGLTRHFEPKPSFYAVAHLQRALGSYRFHHVVTNAAARLRVQEYRPEQNPAKIAWAVWSPTGEGKSLTTTLKSTPGRLVDSQRMPLGSSDASGGRPARQNPDGSVEAEVDESPLYLWFDAS